MMAAVDEAEINLIGAYMLLVVLLGRHKPHWGLHVASMYMLLSYA